MPQKYDYIELFCYYYDTKDLILLSKNICSLETNCYFCNFLKGIFVQIAFNVKISIQENYRRFIGGLYFIDHLKRKFTSYDLYKVKEKK